MSKVSDTADLSSTCYENVVFLSFRWDAYSVMLHGFVDPNMVQICRLPISDIETLSAAISSIGTTVRSSDVHSSILKDLLILVLYCSTRKGGWGFDQNSGVEVRIGQCWTVGLVTL